MPVSAALQNSNGFAAPISGTNLFFASVIQFTFFKFTKSALYRIKNTLLNSIL